MVFSTLDVLEQLNEDNMQFTGRVLKFDDEYKTWFETTFKVCDLEESNSACLLVELDGKFRVINAQIDNTKFAYNFFDQSQNLVYNKSTSWQKRLAQKYSTEYIEELQDEIKELKQLGKKNALLTKNKDHTQVEKVLDEVCKNILTNGKI